jgi:catechol 2,3-dioxygenase-like lactoylglutathione lyase family enzyme
VAVSIRNIVFACPGATDEEHRQEGRALASFYARLLDMRIIREDWFVVAQGLALGLGASPLQDEGEHRSYADPAGHPFCLYRDPTEATGAGRPLSGRIGRVVFDCFSPRTLATFYQGLLGFRTRVQDSPERVLIAADDGGPPMLAFQHAVFPAPRWPDPAYPQQLHLDLHVDDSDAAQELALRLGGIRLPDLGGGCAVFADPAAHPFCLCAAGQ